jgi:hypothetical protein
MGRQNERVSRRYFRRRWDEARGDEHASWGGATYYFDTDMSLMPSRQVEEYDNGNRLLYDESHPHDELGGLTYARVFPENEDEGVFEISAAEFESVWARGRHA